MANRKFKAKTNVVFYLKQPRYLVCSIGQNFFGYKWQKNPTEAGCRWKRKWWWPWLERWLWRSRWSYNTFLAQATPLCAAAEGSVSRQSLCSKKKGRGWGWDPFLWSSLLARVSRMQAGFWLPPTPQLGIFKAQCLRWGRSLSLSPSPPHHRLPTLPLCVGFILPWSWVSFTGLILEGMRVCCEMEAGRKGKVWNRKHCHRLLSTCVAILEERKF